MSLAQTEVNAHCCDWLTSHCSLALLYSMAWILKSELASICNSHIFLSLSWILMQKKLKQRNHKYCNSLVIAFACFIP